MRRVAMICLLCAAMPLMLTACGGGGDGDPAPVRFTVTPSAGANGSIDPATPRTVDQGATTSFTITPDSDYSIAEVSGCGGTLSGNTYTTGAITANCTVTASFEFAFPPAAPTLSLTPRAIKTFGFDWADVAGETEYRLLENADGSSGYSEVASIAAEATSHDLEVFLPGRINASYILQACNSRGCTNSNTVFVSGSLAEAVGYFKASNAEADDRFGVTVALAADGNTLAVGAIFEDSNATGIGGDESNDDALFSGAVYVFTRSGDTWSQQAYVKASNTEEGDLFGVSVALAADGNTLVAGATGEDSNATGIQGDQGNNAAAVSGAVYIFARSAGTWSQQAYVKASNTGASDAFGSTVALAADGNTLAVGVSREDSNATGIGGDQSNDAANGSGAVYVFTRSAGTWSQQAYVKASNTGTNDSFGESVALAADGNTLTVGARLEDSNATGIQGDQGNNAAFNSGAVYVFTRNGDTWSQQAYIKGSNTEAVDFFGARVALTADGNTLAVGASGEDSNATGMGGDQGNNTARNSGAVYVFTRSGDTWSQQAYIKASNPGPDDQFGDTIALAADGSTLAVGAWLENSNAIGIGGDPSDDSAGDSGAVYLY
jgi:hypothetical protein